MLNGSSVWPDIKLKRWPFTNIPVRNLVKCRDIYPPDLSILNLKDMKFLMYNFELEDEYDFSQKFPNLECLIFRSLADCDSKLCLDKLRLLFFSNLSGSTSILIDCPKLLLLKVDTLFGIEIKHPKTLRYISINNFDDKMFNFTNLNFIYVKEIGDRENILQQLPHLKLISIYADDCFGHRFLDTVQTVRNLMIEKQNLKRNVKIIFKRNEIKSIEQLDEIIDEEDPSYYDYDSNPSSDFDGYDS